jgi:hypothetical protein
VWPACGGFPFVCLAFWKSDITELVMIEEFERGKDCRAGGSHSVLEKANGVGSAREGRIAFG